MKITQKKLNYGPIDAGHSGISSQSFDLTKDLSIVNRKNVTQTTGKGVPYVYRFLVTASPAVVYEADSPSNSDYNQPLGDMTEGSHSKAEVHMDFYGCLNNWVMRNGAVKTHAARENMFRNAMVSMKDRGAYSKTIRYKLDSGFSGATPQLGVSTLTTSEGNVETGGSDATGGTWDYTQIIYPDDTNGAFLGLTGAHTEESGSSVAYSYLCMPQLYLASRQKVEADTNLETDETPTDESILNKLLTKNHIATMDEVIVHSRGEQDNPPYDRGHADMAMKTKLGSLRFSVGAGNIAQTIIEAPFGLFEASTYMTGVDGPTGKVNVTVECLGISEM